MHYYKRNIGDYHKKAGRLSILQHGAYTLLMDACYDREEFPTTEDAIDWVWASSEEEISAVKFVLSKFFTEVDGFHVQSRISEDLEKYHANSLTNKRIAIEREKKRKETKRDSKSTKREQVVNGNSDLGNEPPPNHKPLTTNHKPNIKDLSVITDGFDHWWNLYPVSRRKNKGGCLNKFKAKCKKLSEDEVEVLVNQISVDIQKRISEAEDVKYMPMTEPYLNQERWKDGE